MCKYRLLCSKHIVIDTWENWTSPLVIYVKILKVYTIQHKFTSTA